MNKVKAFTLIMDRQEEKFIELTKNNDFDISWEDNNGNNLLTQSIRYSLPKVFTHLLAINVDINAPNSYGTTPLMWSVKEFEFDMFAEIMEKNPEFSSKNKNSETAIMLLLNYKNTKMIDRFVLSLKNSHSLSLLEYQILQTSHPFKNYTIGVIGIAKLQLNLESSLSDKFIKENKIMNRIEGDNKQKNSKMPPVLKKWMKFNFLNSKVEPITEEKVIPKLSLLPLLKSPKLVSLSNKLNSRTKSYSYEEELSCIAMFAISNQSPEIIEELIELKIDINIKVDHFKSKTILAIIVQYPYYHDLFVKLIEAGAKTYCNSILGDESFYSNVLYRSVTYDEFLNITYLIENKHCSLQLALQSCYNQNKLHMLQYFLETCNKEELKVFKDYVTVNKMSRQIEVLDIMQYLS